jgi:hypothetical protein
MIGHAVRALAARHGTRLLLVLPVALMVLAATVTPLAAIPEAAVDDALFVRLARNIVVSGWLGAYDSLTLVKGPGLPLFIAACFVLGIPFLVAVIATHAGAALLLAVETGRAAGSRAVAVAAMWLLALDPIVFSDGMLRSARDLLYVTLTMLIVALGLRLHARMGWALAVRIGAAALLGGAVGAFWITREEGAWILPVLATGWAGSAAARRVFRLGAWGGEALVLAVTVAVAAAAAGAVRLENLRHYGVADEVEFKQPEFVAAYAALARVGPASATPLVVVSRAALARASAAGPHAAALRPFFEGHGPDAYVAVGCATYAVTPCDGELRAGWFMWALRDAAAQAGFHRSATMARAYYAGLAAEIDAACATGSLQCAAPGGGLAPPLRLSNLWRAAASLVRMVGFVVTFDGAAPPEAPVSCLVAPADSACARFAGYFDLLRAPVFAQPAWLGGTAALPDFAAWRAASRDLLSVRAWDRLRGVLTRVAVGFALTGPPGVLAALALFGLAALRALRARAAPPTLWLAALCALVAGVRLAAIAYVDAVAIPSVNVQYLGPVYPFLLVFCVLAVAAARSARQPRARQAPGASAPGTSAPGTSAPGTSG